MSTSLSQSKRPKPRRRWWQYSLSTLFVVMAIAAFVAWLISPKRQAANYVERDLALELKVLEGDTVQWGRDESFELSLVNRSARRSHYVLEHQLRFIYCEAKYRTRSGEWANVLPWRPKGPYAGGALIDYYTEYDLEDIPHVVTPWDIKLLAPEDRFSTRLEGPSNWDLPNLPVKVRMRFHCVYDATKLEVQLPMTIASDGRLTYEPNGLEPLLVAVQEVPSFHLVSPWVEFTLK